MGNDPTDWGLKPSTYKQLLREVRKFSPQTLLPLIARAAAAQTQARAADPANFLQGGIRLTSHGFRPSAPLVTPWGLAGVAREVLLYGEGSAKATPSMHNVYRLCSVFGNLDDPLLHPNSPGSSTEGFMIRSAFEQFRCQVHPFTELARTRALYLDAASEVTNAPLLSARSWEMALGCPLDDFLRIAFLLHVWAGGHEGWVDLAWLELPQFADLTKAIPVEVIRSAVTSHLSCSRNRFRKKDAETLSRLSGPERRRLERYRFNPLEGWPLVQLSGRLIAPQPMYLLDRVTSTGIYYDRCEENGFTDQLGRVFEHYVGKQLELIPNVRIFPEIEYDKGTKKTVDWIVVFDEIVLLVEAKVTRLTEKARLGLSSSLRNDVDRVIVKSHRQIETTADLLLQGHPLLAEVPVDRPMLGMVVTLERYWTLGIFEPIPRPNDATIPLLVASSKEIEDLASSATVHPIGPMLRDILASGRTGGQALEHHLRNLKEGRNPLLDAAWDRSLDFLRESNLGAA